MRRSLAIALLWGFAALFLWELGWSIAEWPRPIGPVLAVVAAGLAVRFASPRVVPMAPVRVNRRSAATAAEIEVAS